MKYKYSPTKLCALAIGLAMSSLGTAYAATQADTLFTQASIYGHPNANTVAVKDGNIVFIGSAKNSEAYKSRQTQIINLKGKALYPGFVDNHNHVFEAASDAGGSCEVSPDATLEEQVPYLQVCKRQAKRGQWVTGYGHYLELILTDDDERTPLEVLDSIFPDQPVVIMEQTSHSMWVNSVALKQVGFTPKTADPQGGVILKEEGYLLGILLDNAGDIVMEKAWNSLKNKFNASYDGLLAGLEEAAKHGITTIGDGRLYWKRGWYEVWKAAEKDNEITARVSLRPWVYPEGNKQQQLAFFKKVYNNNPNSLLISNQVKMYSDGLLENGTAKLLSRYKSTIIPQYPYGLNYISQKDMQWWLAQLNRIGYGAHIHTIGDGGVHESLNAIAALRQAGSKKSYTLTHVEFVNNADLDRFKALNVGADFQLGSDHVLHLTHPSAAKLLGIRKEQNFIPVNQLYQRGVNVSLSSDWNVNPINPLMAIANAVTMGSRGLPNVNAAVDAYTINAAKSLGLDHITGSIEVGKSADFAVLSHDIQKLSPQQIKRTKIQMTVLQGEVVYPY